MGLEKKIEAKINATHAKIDQVVQGANEGFEVAKMDREFLKEQISALREGVHEGLKHKGVEFVGLKQSTVQLSHTMQQNQKEVVTEIQGIQSMVKRTPGGGAIRWDDRRFCWNPWPPTKIPPP